ncbi:hypothetical protein [Burkholderia multivorans]|nr:hypothetical protein [Burkholderia multivorans]
MRLIAADIDGGNAKVGPRNARRRGANARAAPVVASDPGFFVD